LGFLKSLARVVSTFAMKSLAVSVSSQTGRSRSKKEEAFDDLLQRLGIEDDELNDLIFEDGEAAPKEGRYEVDCPC
jgi:hypothetical protein